MIFTIASQQGLPTAPVLVKIIVVLETSQVIVICFKNISYLKEAGNGHTVFFISNLLKHITNLL
jgi:hypothetical protein